MCYKADIKLFVCCHKPEPVPDHPLLVPIQAGAALADDRFPGFLHDDEGDNISVKNRSYCELTTQYWAWKNVKADYYGFFHYRRYLYPDLTTRAPYRIEKEPSRALLDKLGYGKFDDLIQKYELIAPIGEDMYISVREHYAQAPFHHIEDLKLAEEIVREKSPEMFGPMEKYLSGSICYFGNMYIMRHELFVNYCNWLFDILGEFDKKTNKKYLSDQEKRVDGYLAERLFGSFVTAKKEELSEKAILEIPRVHFLSENYKKQKIINTFFPPSTYRRHAVKKLATQSGLLQF